MHEVMGAHVTQCNQGVTTENHDKSLIDKGVTSVTRVTNKKTMQRNESGGGVGVATSDIFRAKLQQAGAGLPVELAVLVAEFANDAEDLAMKCLKRLSVRLCAGWVCSARQLTRHQSRME